ncbi:MAG TPA: PSD1 and planctomycete cytochrome C domain-containing protein [Pirellulales bacterium]|jgi:mono/diheme cytochrome c family protein|nr:PSD1 and planctomycete cytochrome C domain-containing protein [Pirellulales bacterium]
MLRCLAQSTATALTVLALISAEIARADSPRAEGIEFFENEIRPLLARNCFECHGENEKPSGGVRLDSRAAILRGGESGPVVAPGKPDESLLIEAVRYRSVEMPPKGKLPDEQVAKLVRWVEMGLPWPDGDEKAAPVPRGASFEITAAQRQFWSFQPVVSYSPPPVRGADWPLSDIDRFILAGLEARQLAPNPPADKRTLLRRVTFDLTGLPPTPAEIDSFVTDDSPEALAVVVDRLLGSQQYGERWGRHWLDVVRYADTAGDVADYPVPQAYRYRNYVIDAMNRDKPYDAFVREQVAGDVLAKTGQHEQFAELTTATGYVAITKRFGYDRHRDMHLVIGDTLDTLGKSILGLSIGCARCHDHKFDPISSADYYALYGVFASTVYPFPGAEEAQRPVDLVPLLPPAEAAPRLAAHAEALAAAAAEIVRLEAALATLNEQIAQLKNAACEPRTPPTAGEQNASADEQKQQGDDLKSRLAQTQQALTAARERHAQLSGQGPLEMAYAVAEGKPQNASIHLRGDPTRHGPEQPRRFLEILGGQWVPADTASSGRLELADWLVSPSNPLTARVMVNRVWQHHFGKGLVSTPSDFGSRGSRPTHPELLDYLATRFVDGGWSIKKLHRLIVLSQAYRMSSADREDGLAVDPQNDLLWRMDCHRLDAECIRDAILAVSGQLDPAMGGAHPFPPVQTWKFTVHAPFRAIYPSKLRSVYLMTQRIQKDPFLALFDGADPSASTAERTLTTTPGQALYMMNDPFLHEQSLAFARRLTAMAGDDATRVAQAFELAYGRPPTMDETQGAIAFLAGYRTRSTPLDLPEPEQTVQAWAGYLRVLLASNEFLFVD